MKALQALIARFRGRTPVAPPSSGYQSPLPEDAAANALLAAQFANTGADMIRAGRLHEALDNLDAAIAFAPTLAEAHGNRGIALLGLGNLETALQSLQEAIRLSPSYADAYSNAGHALRLLDKKDEALAMLEAAARLKPGSALLQSNLGSLLLELGRTNEAEAIFTRAIELDPQFAQAHCNLGAALAQRGAFEEAAAEYDRALEIDSRHSDALFNKSLLLLMRGDFENGWPLYEERWSASVQKPFVRDFSAPQWSGQAVREGETLLLHCEQGLGDTLQFCRFASQVPLQGGRLVLEAPAAMLRLLESLDADLELVSQGEELPQFDFHCPLASLPYIFGTRTDNIPGAHGYLKAPPDLVEQWSRRLGIRSKPRIGLVWSGGLAHPNDARRSIRFEELASHLPEGFEYFSLHKEVRDGDKPLLQNSSVHDLSQVISDFGDTAALCELMDLILTVDTSVAHLAGALGRPTWILLPTVPDWRWMLGRSDSPWYMSVRLFRSDHPAWAPVLEQVSDQLSPVQSGGAAS